MELDTSKKINYCRVCINVNYQHSYQLNFSTGHLTTKTFSREYDRISTLAKSRASKRADQASFLGVYEGLF